MRSRFLVCVALAGFALANGRSLVAHAADAKAKGAKKKSDDSEDKTGIGKTLQWEDKVMGPDDKKSELDKIRRAQEINKAAAEKAERERAANAAREAKEKEAAAKAGPTTQKRGGEVALPTLPDEGPGNKGKAQHTEVSPKIDTEAAKTPPPALKPADDKFIDKLLKEDSGPKKKRASSAEDKALVDMLATEKPSKATGKKGKKDGVDDLLNDAENAAPMPERKIKHETPEWAKPEIRESAPAPAMVAMPKPIKHDDGVIRVVQGAAGTSPPAGSARSAVATTTTTRSTSSAPAGSGTRKQTAAINSRPGEWADPFSDPPSRKAGATKQVASAKRSVVDDDDFRPTRRAAPPPPPPPAKRAASRASSSDWDDPFSDPKSTSTRRAAPAETSKPTKAAPVRGKSGKWDDPFTSNDDAPAARKSPARAVVATRAPAAKNTTGAKKLAPAPAQHQVVAAAAAADAPAKAPAQGRWGILKKRR
jgi:hypothetical protein